MANVTHDKSAGSTDEQKGQLDTSSITIERMAMFCKEKGFVFPSAEIYGGISGFWDFGPLGVELKSNIKRRLWDEFVAARRDVVGMDGAIITNPRVWKASGHVDSFADLVVVCAKEKRRFRADQFIEEALGIDVAGLTAEKANELIKERNLVCPVCKSPFKDVTSFNPMFVTEVGAAEGATQSYLRPETAQMIFTNFRLVMESSRMKLPFGIAQSGKAFRNEISPRDFLFRSREFEQFELEFFANPQRIDESSEADFERIKDVPVQFLDAKSQEAGNDARHVAHHVAHHATTIGMMHSKKCFHSAWHAIWLGQFYKWFLDHGIRPENLRIREHKKNELAHYAAACFDIEYNFPFGWKEIHGSADRGSFDLSAHAKHSTKDLSVFDETSKKKVMPRVVCEPSQGIERAMLAFLFDAYRYDVERGNIVLGLDRRLAPVQVGVFPLVNKLAGAASGLHDELRASFRCIYDQSGSIGRRYARADEIGIPLCITLDFESLDDKKVTVRNRDTKQQDRVEINGLKEYLRQKLLNL